MPKPIRFSLSNSARRRFALVLLALGLGWARPSLGLSPTAQALYRPIGTPAAIPIQTLWNNGIPWSWDGVRLSLRADPGVGMAMPEDGPAIHARSLALSADAPCLKGCDADVLRLVLPAQADAGVYLKAGHLQFEVKRTQAMTGQLQVWFGRDRLCYHCSLPLESIKLGAYTHVSLPLAGFTSDCPVSPYVTVPFRLSLKHARYNAGPLLALKFIRWTAD